jgi:DNA-binding MarR family transcriptional regulator
MNGIQTKMGKLKGKNGLGDEVQLVMDSIRRIVKLLRIGSRDAEKRAGLTGAQLFVLQKLAEDKVLSVNDLAQRTHTHQSSVSVVVQSLVDKGLVTRSRAAEDGRRLDLALTASARALLRKAPGTAQNRLIEAIENLPGPTRTQLAKLLARLVSEAGLQDEEPTMIFEDGLSPKPATAKRRSK